MRRASLFWGLVLVSLGFLFLLSNLGILPINPWQLVGPLFLVLLGLGMLLGALSSRQTIGERCVIPLESAASGRIRIRHGAGRLSVTGGAAGDRLVEAGCGSGLAYRSRKRGEVLEAEMSVRWDFIRFGPMPWMWGRNDSLDWIVKLNESIPLRLDFESGASDTHLDLSNLQVTDLSIKTGASSTQVVLPASAGRTLVRVKGGAAAISFRVPQDVAARIRVHGGLAGVQVDTGRFPGRGNTFESQEFANAGNRVEIDAELGVGSLEVR